MSRNVGAYDSLIPMPQDGESLYTWMKYADDAQGNGMSDSPEGKAYVGFAYNKPTPVESDNPADYKWQKVEGAPGGDALTLLVGTPVLTVSVDGEDDTVLQDMYLSSDVQMLKGGEVVALIDTGTSTLTATVDNPQGGTTVSVIYDVTSGKNAFTVMVYVPKGQYKSIRSTKVSLALTHKTVGTAYGSIVFSYVQRGTVGPAGKTIPQPYSCGWWDAYTDYVVKNNYAPLVAHPKTANPLFYVRTDNDLKYGTDGKPLDPATDYATYSGKGAWLLFEKYAAILVNMLMANWARFGSSEGGVFWEHYLFSALGVPQGGSEAVDYSTYVGSSSPIFDEDTKELTGIFTPNLLIDFKNGRIHCKDVDITGIVNATDGTFRGEVNIARGKILFNRDGGGSIAGKGLVWDSVGDMHQAYGMQPLWLSVQKAITLKDRFLYMSAYGGHMLDVLLGVYFNTQWDVTTAGDNCHQYLLLPTPQSFTSLGTVEDIYIKISKRELFFFWFKTDEVTASFSIVCHKDGFIRLRKNSGEITSLKKGDSLVPKEGVICKLEYTGTYWFGEYMDFNVFILS